MSGTDSPACSVSQRLRRKGRRGAAPRADAYARTDGGWQAESAPPVIMPTWSLTLAAAAVALKLANDRRAVCLFIVLSPVSCLLWEVFGLPLPLRHDVLCGTVARCYGRQFLDCVMHPTIVAVDSFVIATWLVPTLIGQPSLKVVHDGD